VEECERLGLKIGTHNSPGWSSTGFKTVAPAESMQKVVFTETPVTGGRAFSGLLAQPETNHGYYRDIACWAIKDQQVVALAECLNISPQLQATGQLVWQVPEGKWVLVRIGHTTTGAVNLTAPVSGQGLEVDKLDAVPLQHYWESFPTDLLALAGAQAGTTFTRFEIDSYEQGLQNWTGMLPVEFARRRGYDMLPRLLSVTGRAIESPAYTARFKHDWNETVNELFAENYFHAMQQLVHRVPGIELILEPYATGHAQPFESNNVGAFADLPMCEFWQKPTPWGWDSLKPTVSGAHTWGKPLVAAEAFTGQPISAWKVDPYALKSVGDRAFAGGVNQLFFHTSAHQPWQQVLPGMTMGQWGTHFGRTQTWWTNGGQEWIRYLTRSQFLLQQGLPVADILYLTYARLTPAPLPGFTSETIGTSAFLSRLSVVNGALSLPDGVTYQVLVLPDTEAMQLDIAQQVKALVHRGALVVGPKPKRTPGLTAFEQNDQLVAAIGEELWGREATALGRLYGAGKVFWPQPMEQVLTALRLQSDCEVVTTTAETPLLWIHRRLPGADIYFVSNQTDKSITAELSLRQVEQVPEYWDADTGKTEEAPYSFVKGNRLHLPLALAPSGAVFIVLRKKRTTSHSVKSLVAPTGPAPYLATVVHETAGKRVKASANGSYLLTYTDGTTKQLLVQGVPPAVAVLPPWKLRFLQQRGATDCIVQQLGSWTDFADQSRYYSGTATYETDFLFSGKKATKDWEYVLDLGVVYHTVRLQLNGQDLGLQWKPPYRYDLTPHLKNGQNHLEVSVTNLWANRLIGDEQFPDDLQWSGNLLKEIPAWVTNNQPRPEPRRQAFTTYKFFTRDAPLLPSGLLGPVMLHTVKAVKVD
jgi:hypothetical protein